MERLLAAYRERYGEIGTDTPAPQPQQPGYPPPPFFPPAPGKPEPAQPPQSPMDESDFKQIDDIITQRAMLLSGLSQEDVDGIDYLEDDDPRLSKWKHAKKLAEAATYNEFVSSQIAQQQEAQRIAALRNQSVTEYNNYVARQQAGENFDALRAFATGEFYESQSPLNKAVLAESFARMQNGTAIPADAMVMHNFFEGARQAFEKNKLPHSPGVQKNPPAKPKFPRTDKMQGAPGSGGGVSETALAEMLRTKNWRNISPEYKRQLLGL